MRPESGGRLTRLECCHVDSTNRVEPRVPLSGHLSYTTEPRAEALGYSLRPFHGQQPYGQNLTIGSSDPKPNPMYQILVPNKQTTPNQQP